MKNLLLYLILGLGLLHSCKESNLQNVGMGNDSINVLLDLAADKNLTRKQRLNYTVKAQQLIAAEKNDSLNRANRIKIANRYYNLDSLEGYKSTTEEVIALSKTAKDTATLAKAYSYLGDYYADQYISEFAFMSYVDAEKLYRKLRDFSKTSAMLVNKATLQLNEKDYVGAEKSAYEAIKLLRHVDNSGLRYDAYNLLGVIYMQLFEFDTSIDYHNKALLETEASGFEDAEYYRSSSLNNLGVVSLHKKDYSRAANFFRQASKSKDLEQENPGYYIIIKLNIYYCQLKLDQMQGLPMGFYDVMSQSDHLNLKEGMVGSRLNVGEYYLKIKDTANARKYTSDAYNIAKFHGMTREVLLCLNQLSDIDPLHAGKYSKEYIKTNDSIQVMERQIRNKLGRVEYETDELAQEKEQLLQQRKTLILIAFAIILIATLIFIIRMQAAKNRELKLLQEQQKANEEIFHLMISQQDKIEEERQKEKKRIARELHDGVLGKLFGTRMNLGILNDRRHDEQTVVQRGAFIDDLKSIEQELREISHDLSREQQAVYNNFVQMVGNFIASQKTVCTAGIHYTMDRKIAWAEVPNNTKINLYRILQEAFQNINKHASATAVDVKFMHSEEGLSLLVSDNGVGFNYSKKRNGIGLQNMQSRITDSKGSMVVTTATGEGTSLEFTIASHLAFR